MVFLLILLNCKMYIIYFQMVFLLVFLHTVRLLQQGSKRTRQETPRRDTNLTEWEKVRRKNDFSQWDQMPRKNDHVEPTENPSSHFRCIEIVQYSNQVQNRYLSTWLEHFTIELRNRHWILTWKQLISIIFSLRNILCIIICSVLYQVIHANNIGVWHTAIQL